MKNTKILIAVLSIAWTVPIFGKDIASVYYKKYDLEKTVQGKALVVEGFIYGKSSFFVVDSFFLKRLPTLLDQALAEENLYAANISRLAMAINYRRNNKADEALLLLNEIGDYFYKNEQLKNHFLKAQYTGVFYCIKGLNKEALDQVLILESIRKYLGNWINLNVISELKGDALHGLKRYKEAEKEYQVFLKNAKKLGRPRLIAEAYGKLGGLAQITDDLDLAQAYFMKSAEFAYKSGLKEQIGSAKTSLAIIEFIQGNRESAKDFFIGAYEAQKNSNNPTLICNALFNVGVFYFDTGKLEEAIPYFAEMLKLAETNGLLERQTEALTEFAHLYTQLGNETKAIEYYEQLIEVKGKLQEKSLSESKGFYSEFALLSIRDEKLNSEAKEKLLLKRLTDSNRLAYGMMIVVFLLITIVVYKIKRERGKEINSISVE
ncbi:MAG: tetratricopeptide repeat protein [Bacteroidetes bacterium]|nr:tetratricopeptide repeat protein [Bacteroidota bacterium]